MEQQRRTFRKVLVANTSYPDSFNDLVSNMGLVGRCLDIATPAVFFRSRNSLYTNIYFDEPKKKIFVA